MEYGESLKSKDLDFNLSEIDIGSTEMLSEIMSSLAQAWAGLELSLAAMHSKEDSSGGQKHEIIVYCKMYLAMHCETWISSSGEYITINLQHDKLDRLSH